MVYYLPIALLFAGLLSWLMYYTYQKKQPGVLLIGGLIMVLILRAQSSLYPYIWNTDEAEWLSLARTLPYCSVPYKCFDPHSTGFLNILVFKSLDYLGIEYTYSSLRLFSLFVYIIPSVLLFYYILRRQYSERVTILGIGLLFHYILFGSYGYDLFSYHSEQSLMCLTALAYYSYVRYKADGKLGYLILAALAIGLLPFFKLQSVPIVLALTLIFFIRFFRTKKYLHGVIFCTTGVVPLTCFLLLFWQSGVLYDFWQMYIVSNQYLVKYFTTTKFIGKIKVFIFMQGWQIAYLLIIGLLIWLGYRSGKVTLDKIKKIDPAPVLLLGAGYFAIATPGQGMQHYFTLITIPLFLFVTNLIYILDLESFFSSGRRRIGYYAGLSAVAAFYLLLPEVNAFKPHRYHPRRPDSENLVKLVDQEVPKDSTICVLGWFDAVEVQVSCNRPIATRTAHTYYLLADKDTALMNYYHRQYIADLDSSRPRLIIDPKRTISWTAGPFWELNDSRMEPVRRYIEQKYRRQESMIDSCIIYRRI